MENVCVFSGSRLGRDPRHQQAAAQLGESIAARGLGLVYGGASVGLMNLVADAALRVGGRVIGVIPAFLAAKELAHPALTELHVVDTMSARKALMARLSGAFVALPGGFGTFEEYGEMLTWTQMKLHDRPCGLLNVGGFYDPLLAQFDRAYQDGFVLEDHRALVLSHPEGPDLLDLLGAVRQPARSAGEG